MEETKSFGQEEKILKRIERFSSLYESQGCKILGNLEDFTVDLLSDIETLLRDRIGGSK